MMKYDLAYSYIIFKTGHDPWTGVHAVLQGRLISIPVHVHVYLDQQTFTYVWSCSVMNQFVTVYNSHDLHGGRVLLILGPTYGIIYDQFRWKKYQEPFAM